MAEVSTSAPFDFSPALVLLERTHTLLADLFPHEGLRAIGGSRVFVGSPVLPLVRNCFRDVLAELARSGPAPQAAAVVPLLAEAVRLLERIEKRAPHSDERSINNAAMLLYLASGLSWNFLRRSLAGPAPHSPDYVNVEPVSALLALCGRQAAADQGTRLEGSLYEVRGEIGMALRRSW
jgi:hypothetical protein